MNPKFDLRQLRTFVAVAEAGGLSHAAARLHLSQPAASAQIKALEMALGVQLFARRANGLLLTRHGATLMPEAQRLLAAAGALAANAQRLKGEAAGRLRLGTFFDPALVRLGQVMGRMVALHPMVEIEIRHASSLSLVAELGAGEIDAAFVLGLHARPELTALPLAAIEYRIVAPLAWRARLGRASWREIMGFPWISTPRGGSHHQMMGELFRRYGAETTKVIEADGEIAISSLVTAGVGLALMRTDLANAAAAEKRVYVLSKGRARTVLSFVAPKARESEPALRALSSVVRDIWKPKPRRMKLSP